MPPLIFLNRLGMFSSSNGSEPHSSAYRITPQLHTSTSGPAYSLPEMTCRGGGAEGAYVSYKDSGTYSSSCFLRPLALLGAVPQVLVVSEPRSLCSLCPSYPPLTSGAA